VLKEQKHAYRFTDKFKKAVAWETLQYFCKTGYLCCPASVVNYVRHWNILSPPPLYRITVCYV